MSPMKWPKMEYKLDMHQCVRALPSVYVLVHYRIYVTNKTIHSMGRWCWFKCFGVSVYEFTIVFSAVVSFVVSSSSRMRVKESRRSTLCAESTTHEFYLLKPNIGTDIQQQQQRKTHEDQSKKSSFKIQVIEIFSRTKLSVSCFYKTVDIKKIGEKIFHLFESFQCKLYGKNWPFLAIEILIWITNSRHFTTFSFFTCSLSLSLRFGIRRYGEEETSFAC